MKPSPSDIDQLLADPRIDDTFAEAFEMRYTRLVVTAASRHWLEQAAAAFCGYGSSVIGCDAECGIEQFVLADTTPDGRPGVALLAFSFSREKLAAAVVNRAGQCLMTCPTTAVFNGLDSDRTIILGGQLRYFGDGFQKSKLLGERRFWRIPVMDGEFIVEEQLGVADGIGGGNFVIAGDDAGAALDAARAAVDAIAELDHCITPFPGGIARSGSKVGSQYKNQVASTAETFCPTLRGRVTSQLHESAVAAYEVVIDGTGEEVIRRSMRRGIAAALASSHADRIVQISAGNYGGQLGKCLVPLHSLRTGP